MTEAQAVDRRRSTFPQAHAEAGDLLEDLGELPSGGEELGDLGVDARDTGLLARTRALGLLSQLCWL